MAKTRYVRLSSAIALKVTTCFVGAGQQRPKPVILAGKYDIIQRAHATKERQELMKSVGIRLLYAD
jgi:hypothetical protein